MRPGRMTTACAVVMVMLLMAGTGWSQRSSAGVSASYRLGPDDVLQLNVLQQLANTCHSNIVQAAWSRGQALTAHGWIYSIRDGLLKDLGASVDGPDQIPKEYRIGSPE